MVRIPETAPASAGNVPGEVICHWAPERVRGMGCAAFCLMVSAVTVAGSTLRIAGVEIVGASRAFFASWRPDQ